MPRPPKRPPSLRGAASDPTEAEIRQACERIRSGWSESEYAKRAGTSLGEGRDIHNWQIPLVSTFGAIIHDDVA